MGRRALNEQLDTVLQTIGGDEEILKHLKGKLVELRPEYDTIMKSIAATEERIRARTTEKAMIEMLITKIDVEKLADRKETP
jgi:predicted  nucleic acid-binding Zn-ribbon protein